MRIQRVDYNVGLNIRHRNQRKFGMAKPHVNQFDSIQFGKFYLKYLQILDKIRFLSLAKKANSPNFSHAKLLSLQSYTFG